MITLLNFVCTKCRTWKGVRRIVCPYGAIDSDIPERRTDIYGHVGMGIFSGRGAPLMLNEQLIQRMDLSSGVEAAAVSVMTAAPDVTYVLRR